MKKIITLLLLFVTLGVQAQIQNTFWGLKLGVSTKNDVLKYAQSLENESKIENDMLLIYNKNFAGERWDCVAFKFFEDILLGVSMLKNENAVYKSEDIIHMYEKFAEKLNSKYASYRIDKYCSADNLYFSDNITTLSLDKSDNSLGKYITIIYSDYNLNIKKIQHDKEEL